jgi:hypothetical protein
MRRSISACARGLRCRSRRHRCDPVGGFASLLRTIRRLQRLADAVKQVACRRYRDPTPHDGVVRIPLGGSASERRVRFAPHEQARLQTGDVQGNAQRKPRMLL